MEPQARQVFGLLFNCYRHHPQSHCLGTINLEVISECKRSFERIRVTFDAVTEWFFQHRLGLISRVCLFCVSFNPRKKVLEEIQPQWEIVLCSLGKRLEGRFLLLIDEIAPIVLIKDDWFVSLKWIKRVPQINQFSFRIIDSQLGGLELFPECSSAGHQGLLMWWISV